MYEKLPVRGGYEIYSTFDESFIDLFESMRFDTFDEVYVFVEKIAGEAYKSGKACRDAFLAARKKAVSEVSSLFADVFAAAVVSAMIKEEQKHAW